MLISKNWSSDPHFGLRHVVDSLDDFGDFETNLWSRLKNNFEDCMEEFVDFNDMTKTNF